MAPSNFLEHKPDSTLLAPGTCPADIHGILQTHHSLIYFASRLQS